MTHTCDPTQHCRLCELAGSPTPARSATPAAVNPVPVPELPPCLHRGEPVKASAISEAGFSPIREHRYCGHPTLSLGIVSECRTCTSPGVPKAPLCGETCAGYTPSKIAIEQGAGGIGDGLLGLTAVAQLAADNPGVEIEYRVSDLARPFVALFDVPGVKLGKVSKVHNDLPVPGARQMNLGYVEQDAEWKKGSTRSRGDRYAENIGASGTLIPPLRNPDRIRALGSAFDGFAILCPFSTDIAREWGSDRWLALESLLHAAGWRTAVAHSSADRCEPFESEKLVGLPPEWAAGAMRSAALVIGTDSGPAHMAGILGVPTLVLGGSPPVERIFGGYPRVRCIQAGHLADIDPAVVFGIADDIALRSVADRSLVSDDRLAVLRDCTLATNGLPGDVAELGVFRGGTAKLIGHFAPGARLHLFDTFTGIPEDDAAPAGHHRRGDFPSDVEDVRRYLSNPNAIFRVGVFPATAPRDGVRFRLVHIDGDILQTTEAALDWFGRRMVPGGIIVLDDFEWENCPGVATAVRERFAESRIEVRAKYQAVVRF
jgi:hypothetical protein